MSERECNNSSCDKSSCEGCPSRQQPQSFQVEANEYSCIRRVIGVVRAAARAVAVGLTVHCAITVAMLDREIDLEITDQGKALLEKLRPKTWKRGAMKIRDALTARKKTNVPGKIIFTRKTRR